MWFTRPLSPSLLKILALEATYLLPLRLVLLDEMMSDLTTLVDRYLNTYREGSANWLGGAEVGAALCGWVLTASASALFLEGTVIPTLHSCRKLHETDLVTNIFFKDFIYLFLERRKGREKERERNIKV